MPTPRNNSSYADRWTLQYFFNLKILRESQEFITGILNREIHSYKNDSKIPKITGFTVSISIGQECLPENFRSSILQGEARRVHTLLIQWHPACKAEIHYLDEGIFRRIHKQQVLKIRNTLICYIA